MIFADPVSANNAVSARWLSIVGIGEDGVAALSPGARALVESAEVVFGGQRHLALAAPLIHGRARSWPTPFGRAVADVLGERPRICVLASGDPFHYGIGAELARQVPPAEMVTVPAPSAFSLAAARLGWPLAETACTQWPCARSDSPASAPGRPDPGAERGSGDAERARAVTGGDRLWPVAAHRPRGTGRRPRTFFRTTLAADFELAAIDPLNTMAIEVVAGAQARIIPRAPGLANSLFEHDGQITKREVRALALSHWRHAVASGCGTSAPAPVRWQ